MFRCQSCLSGFSIHSLQCLHFFASMDIVPLQYGHCFMTFFHGLSSIINQINATDTPKKNNPKIADCPNVKRSVLSTCNAMIRELDIKPIIPHITLLWLSFFAILIQRLTEKIRNNRAQNTGFGPIFTIRIFNVIILFIIIIYLYSSGFSNSARFLKWYLFPLPRYNLRRPLLWLLCT